MMLDRKEVISENLTTSWYKLKLKKANNRQKQTSPKV